MVRFSISIATFFAFFNTTWAIFEESTGLANDSIAKANVYVWDFSINDFSNEKHRKIAISLTNFFETELVGLNSYVVLERRRYDRVQSLQNLEKRVLEIDDLNQQAKDTLKAIKANAVFFGEIVHNTDAGLFMVSVKFQSLEGVILKKKDIKIPQLEIEVPRIQQEMMKKLVSELHKEELEKVKLEKEAELKKIRKEEYGEIMRILDTYIMRAENVNSSFETIGKSEFQFDEEYLNELTSNIHKYNEIFEEIKNGHSQMFISFSSHWNKQLSEELYEIFDAILYDIHDQVIFRRLNKVREEIVTYRQQSLEKKLSNSQKENRKQDLIREISRITNELASKIRTVDGTKRSFVMKLTQEITQ